jgi:hypothetical protein
MDVDSTDELAITPGLLFSSLARQAHYDKCYTASRGPPGLFYENPEISGVLAIKDPGHPCLLHQGGVTIGEAIFSALTLIRSAPYAVARNDRQYRERWRHRGITRIVVADKGNGHVGVAVRASHTSLPFVLGEVPLAATAVFGGAASQLAGECGEITFGAKACTVNAAGTKISCR